MARVSRGYINHRRGTQPGGIQVDWLDTRYSSAGRTLAFVKTERILTIFQVHVPSLVPPLHRRTTKVCLEEVQVRFILFHGVDGLRNQRCSSRRAPAVCFNGGNEFAKGPRVVPRTRNLLHEPGPIRENGREKCRRSLGSEISASASSMSDASLNAIAQQNPAEIRPPTRAWQTAARERMLYLQA